MMEDALFGQGISHVFCFFFYQPLVFQDQPFRIRSTKRSSSRDFFKKNPWNPKKVGPGSTDPRWGCVSTPQNLGEITPRIRTGVEPERGGTEWRDRGGTSTTKGTTEQRNSEPWLVVGCGKWLVYSGLFLPDRWGQVDFLFFYRYFFISRGSPEVFGRVWKFCLEFSFFGNWVGMG